MERSTAADAGRYAPAQIVLHWAVVALVVVQVLSHGAMEEFWGRVERGEASGFPGDPVALLHAGSGATILVLMIARFALRTRFGAPPLPADMPDILKVAARANHYAFYGLLVLLPLSGATALLFKVEASAGLHGVLVVLLLLLIAAHLAGVAYHAFFRRDGVVWRMLPRRGP